RATFGLSADDRFAQLTSLSFDVVLRDVLTPLISGATLCLRDDPEDLSPETVVPWLARERITCLHIVPSLTHAWLQAAPSDVSLPCARWTFSAGEALTSALASQWQGLAPNGKVVVLYGPSETTLAKCFHVVSPDGPLGVQPVGRA